MTTSVNIFDNQYSADILTVRNKWNDAIVGTFAVAAGIAIFFDNESAVYEWAFPYDGTRAAKRAIAEFCGGYDPSDLRFSIN